MDFSTSVEMTCGVIVAVGRIGECFCGQDKHSWVDNLVAGGWIWIYDLGDMKIRYLVSGEKPGLLSG